MIPKARTVPSPILKRTITIDDHNTSVTLEDAFWGALREIAVHQNMRISELVSRIDKERKHANLSSAIRLYVLDHYRRMAEEHAHRKGKRVHER